MAADKVVQARRWGRHVLDAAPGIRTMLHRPAAHGRVTHKHEDLGLRHQGASCVPLSLPSPWRSRSAALPPCLPARSISWPSARSIAGTATDFSGQSGSLENGVRGDLLGGIGSGLSWAGGSTFLALPDRGPNAVAWNASVDNTSSFIPRFHTLTLALTQTPDTSTGLPFTLVPSLVGTTLLYSKRLAVAS